MSLVKKILPLFTIKKGSEFLCSSKKRYAKKCKYCSNKVEQPAKEDDVCDCCYILLEDGGLR